MCCLCQFLFQKYVCFGRKLPFLHAFFAVLTLFLLTDGSSTGLLMTTQQSVIDDILKSNDLSKSLNISRTSTAVPSNRHNSSSGVHRHLDLGEYLQKNTNHGDNSLKDGCGDSSRTFKAEISGKVDFDPLLVKPLNEVTDIPLSDSKDRMNTTVPNLTGSGDTGSKVVSGDIIGAMDILDTGKEKSTTTPEAINSAYSTPSHSGSQMSLSPQHSIRTPVTENDPLGLFNLNSELSFTVSEPTKVSSDSRTPKGTPSKSNKYQLLLDLQPFSSSTPTKEENGTDSIIERTNILSDATTTESSTDPGSPNSQEPWSPLPKSQVKPAVSKAATLPALERSSSVETAIRKTKFLNRTGSFRGAIKSAAGILSNKLYEMKQNYTTPTKNDTGSSQSLPKSTDPDVMTEEENDEFMRKAESLDELGDRLERSQSEDTGGSKSSLKGYMSFGRH